MITIKDAKSISGKKLQPITVESPDNIQIDASTLTVMPGLIDPHVHFRTPGSEHKEDWKSASKAALSGGITTVFDMPNTIPTTTTKKELQDKKQLISSMLNEVGIPLRYHLYFGADKHHYDELNLVKDDIIALKVFMGSSTGTLLIDDDSNLHATFALASKHDILICTHAEDEATVKANQKKYQDSKDFATHSKIRTPHAAVLGVKKAVQLAKLYDVRVHILHVSTKDELDVIEKAKNDGVKITCEVCPPHLFLSTDDYEHLQGKAQVNPALRAPCHHEELFKAINSGLIDTVGSDHAPHTLDEKNKPFGTCPSGMPGVETTLSLLLTAHKEGKVTLQKTCELACTNIQKVYSLPPNDDIILVDTEESFIIKNSLLKTKCSWSAFDGKTCTGRAKYAILRGQVFDLDRFFS